MDRRLPERPAWMHHAPIVIGAALSLAASAGAMDPEARPIPLPGSPGTEANGSMVLPLLVTIGALAVAAWLWMGRRLRAARLPEGCIAVLDRTAMGRGRSLSLVRVGDRVVLVGESAQGFQRLAEFDAGEAPASVSGARRLAS